MQKSRILLLVLNSSGESGLSPVQIQKSLFLLKDKLPRRYIRDYYRFVPHLFGPFDSSIYRDAESLTNEELISISKPMNQNWKVYNITSKGRRECTEIKKQIPSNLLKEVHEVVSLVKRKNFMELLNYIYKKYPSYKKNSVFKNYL